MTETASGYDRQDLEKYYTPAWVTEALIGAVQFGGKVWDPAAGAGHILSAFQTAGQQVLGSDIAPDDAGIMSIDFLEAYSGPLFHGDIATNPPYGKQGKLAERFIARALDLTEGCGGKVAMLLRVDFDSAKTRRKLFGDHPAFAAKYVLTRRIRWANLEQSAAGPTQNHCWCVWDWSKPAAQLPTIGYLPLARAA